LAENTWVANVVDGVLRNHFISSQIFYASVAETKFDEFATEVDDYGLHSGESATLTRISNIVEPLDGTLIETQRIPEDDFKISATQVPVREMGRAIPYTELLRDFAHFNLDNAIQRKLRQQMTLILDTMYAKACKLSLLRYTPTGVVATPTNSFTTTGTFGAVASRSLLVYDLEELATILYDTYQAEPYEGDDYIGIFRFRSLMTVRRDPAWQIWHQYTDPQAKYNGETGRIEQIRCIETNHAQALAYVGTGNVLGEGVVFGADSYAMAENVTPELRAGIPQDYGRSRGIAWYGQIGAKLVWSQDSSNPGESNLIYIGSQ
jgi:N4-gp56 family major capsid protein